MSKDVESKPTVSLFDRLLGRQRLSWITVVLSLLLILAPLGLAYMDGVFDELMTQGAWRHLLLPPAVIIYILAVAPAMARMEAGVVAAFRPLVQMDDEAFERLVAEATRISPRGEVIAFAVGAAFGLWTGSSWGLWAEAVWLGLYVPLSVALMFGLLGWVVYGAMAGTRLIAELHRQPLCFDIFDTEPFEPIGRQSLVIALVFVGGIVLATLFGFNRESIFDWQNWLIIGFLMGVPILIFFLNMRDTHRVLAAEKERELDLVEHQIRQACRTLMRRVEAEEDTGTLAADIDALVVYEGRLEVTRTWPYNTRMLRTLFVSVIIPGIAAVGQLVGQLMTQ